MVIASNFFLLDLKKWMCEGTPKVHYGTIKPGITWYYWNIHIIYTYSTSNESCRQINSEKVWFLTCSSSGRILLSEWWDDRWRRHLSKLSLGTREGVKKNCHFIFIQFLAFKYSSRLRNREGGTIDFSCFCFFIHSLLCWETTVSGRSLQFDLTEICWCPLQVLQYCYWWLPSLSVAP